MDRNITITTLRTTSSCPDRNTCPSVHRVAGMAGRFVVGKRVDDPALRKAFAPLMADDEELTWTPDDLLPEV
jgi:hypothetical protein